MQLPPTILSLDHKKKEKEEKPTARLKVAKDATIRSGPDENSDSDTSSNELEGGGIAQMSISSKRVVLIPPRTLETTLFDRLEKMYGTSIKKMLEIQYR